MNLEKAVKNRLNHYKILKTKLEAVQTKSALISLRNQFIQDQKRMNYQTEYDRVRGELSRSNLQGVTVEKLKNRQNVLEKLGAEAMSSSSLPSSEFSGPSPTRLAKATGPSPRRSAKATSTTQTRPYVKDTVDRLIFNQNPLYWEAMDAKRGFKPCDEELDFNLRGYSGTKAKSGLCGKRRSKSTGEAKPMLSEGKFIGTKEQKQMMKKKMKSMIYDNTWVRL